MKHQKYIVFYFLIPFYFVCAAVFSQETGQMQRVGCICRDDVRQDRTGSGACSGHGGVKYWLYADVGICQQYANDLPAIPDQDLISLTPEEAKKIAKKIAEEATETLPILYEGDKQKDKGKLSKEEQKELEEWRESRQQQRVIQQERGYFQVLDFFMPFVMVLVVILLFLLIVMVIKKVL